MVNPDFRDLFSAFNGLGVRYLVVGGYAVTFHTKPRLTKDLDVWIDADPENARRAWDALRAFGAPMHDLEPGDLSRPGMVYQIGLPPNRIDILTSLVGVEFPAAWERRARARYGACDVQYISREDLAENKRLAGRKQDLLDVEALERSLRKPGGKPRAGHRPR